MVSSEMLGSVYILHHHQNVHFYRSVPYPIITRHQGPTIPPPDALMFRYDRYLFLPTSSR